MISGQPKAFDRQLTILVVDDDDTHVEYLSEMLTMSGYNVAAFHDAPSVLLAVREGLGIDLIITDYRMPGMDGLAFVKSMRSLLPAVPVIMLTAHGDADFYFKAFNLGIFKCINKSVSNDELLEVVRAALVN